MHHGTSRSPELRTGGRTIRRTAVRGVLSRGPELLLQASPRREFREECGYDEVVVGAELATTREEVPAVEAEYDVFAMTSYYFTCSRRRPRRGAGTRRLRGRPGTHAGLGVGE